MKKTISLILLIFFLFSFSLTLAQEKIFEVKKGQSAIEVAKNLKKEKLIKSEFLFLIYLLFKSGFKKIQAGFYLLSPKMPFFEIAEKLIRGEVIVEKITIPEGKDKNEIAQILKEKGILKKEDFLKSISFENWKEKYDFLKEVQSKDLEGFLFPDTYFFKRGENPEKVISKFLENFNKKVDSVLRKEISKKGKSLYQILILASLLEKEVKDFEEKRLVSGILWKRLKNKIPLQVDATITFITKKKTIKISAEDLKIDSPYNTYKYQGLPPTPICNPGYESILAAIFPKDSDFWYYLSTPEGKVIFSKNYKEHLLAKEKYLK